MKWGSRNNTAEKKAENGGFENGDFQVVGSLSICTLPYIFLSLIRTVLPSSMLCENSRKSLNQQIWVWHISKK